MPKLFLLSSLGSRLPIVASVAAHVALVAVAGGHGGGSGHAPVAPAAEAWIDVEAAPPMPEPPPPVPEAHEDHDHTFASHTHAYPVSPDHDAHPHDPSIDHRLAQKAAAPGAPSEPAPAGELAAAAPSVVTASDSNLPTFSIVLGNAGSSAGGLSRAGGTGGGRGVALPPRVDTDAPLEEAMVSVPARLSSSVRPAYPPAARTGGLEADVPLEIAVDAAGNVVDARILRRAGNGFDESALRAVRSYRFTPARHDDAAVRVRMRWTVSFSLE